MALVTGIRYTFLEEGYFDSIAISMNFYAYCYANEIIYRVRLIGRKIITVDWNIFLY